jgi:histidyl-tRNA synthetase
MPFRAVKGMNDILPDEVERWQSLEARLSSTLRSHGYAEVRTPIVESTGLFVRSIGEDTDVVDKEMYSFERHREPLTLRPEGTAGAARAYIEHGCSAKEPVSRWYYLGPMFRAERPQRGRYRQFYQAGAEVYGDPGPAIDAEMIAMLYDFLSSLGISGLEVKINSLGGPETRELYRQALVQYFTPRAAELSEHARARVETNPLRILDSKDPSDQKVSESAPSILDLLSDADREHFEQIGAWLRALQTPFCVEPRLVRGLDYYTRTLFEIVSPAEGLGSQNALVGGGRYDNLVRDLGGSDVAAIGFALGMERLLLASRAEHSQWTRGCFFAPIGKPATERCLLLARQLRCELGPHCVALEVDGRGGSLKSLLRRADALGYRFAVVVGESELTQDSVLVKDLARHAQESIRIAEFIATMTKRLLTEAPAQSSGGTA